MLYSNTTEVHHYSIILNRADVSICCLVVLQHQKKHTYAQVAV